MLDFDAVGLSGSAGGSPGRSLGTLLLRGGRRSSVLRCRFERLSLSQCDGRGLTRLGGPLPGDTCPFLGLLQSDTGVGLRGAVVGEASETQVAALTAYAEDLGLAFSGRGFDMRLIAPFGVPLAEALKIPIYFVLGNHDFYGSSIAATRQSVIHASREHPLLHYLTDESAIELEDDARTGAKHARQPAPAAP